MYFLTKNILQEVYRCYPFIFIFHEFYKHFLRKIKIKIIMNTKNIILYLDRWKELFDNDKVEIREVEEVDDGIHQDGLKITFLHTAENEGIEEESENEIKRVLYLYPDLDIDKDGLVMGKLNGFVKKLENNTEIVSDEEVNTEEITPKYHVEILRTFLKQEINVTFEYPYDEKPGIWVNIEKKFESLYRTYSLEYSQDINNRYNKVKIIFNSLKIRSAYPEINIIVVGDEIDNKEDYKNEVSSAKEAEIRKADIKIAADLDDLTQQVNSISPNTGITVNNVIFPIKAYRISMASISGNAECGKIIDNLYLFTKQNLDESILVCDFEEVETVSESFCAAWTKLLLQTKCKIIPINMNILISATLSDFVNSNIQEITDSDVEE